MTLPDILAAISQGGLPVFLLLIMYGGYKGYWVFGSFYQAMREDRDMWRDIAREAAPIIKSATDLAQAAHKEQRS